MSRWFRPGCPESPETRSVPLAFFSLGGGKCSEAEQGHGSATQGLSDAEQVVGELLEAEPRLALSTAGSAERRDAGDRTPRFPYLLDGE